MFVRRRAELLAHVQNTHTQYNVPTASGKGRDRLREGIAATAFADPSVRTMLDADTEVIDQLDRTITTLDTHVLKHAKVHDPVRLCMLQTIPGVGKVLSLVMLYEIQDVDRFANIGQFVSYARLVSCAKESAGKKQGTGGRKIGNAHLKWAFSEAAALMIRSSPEAKAFMEKMARQRGNPPPSAKGRAAGRRLTCFDQPPASARHTIRVPERGDAHDVLTDIRSLPVPRADLNGGVPRARTRRFA